MSGARPTCKSCRYWSEMIAKSARVGVQAMCLCPTMPRQYTYGSDGCASWADAPHGAIDAPGNENAYPGAAT